MRIGGLQPTSLIDYPGTVCAVIFTVGCNFRCPYCHNPELVLETPERLIPEREVLAFLKKRNGTLPAVTITGGEPTMQKDLLSFMRKVKALGYRVKLDTNGTHPRMLKKAVREKLADYVAMDIKAPFAKYAQVAACAVNTDAIRESVSFLLLGKVEYEFRTTVLRSQLAGEDFESIGKEISGAQRYFLQQFNPAKTLHPAFRSKISYSKEELEAFANALASYVKHCAVRA